MVSLHVDVETLEWVPGSAKYGPVAIHEGKEIIQSKVLSDRRRDGGNLALLSRVSPPPGKLVKIVSVARSDEPFSTSKAGAAQNPGSPYAPLAATRSTRKGRCTAPLSQPRH